MSWPWRCGGLATGANRLARQQQERRRARPGGRGRHRPGGRRPLDEIARVAAAGRRRGRRVPVLLRVTVGVEAHTHEYIATAHEDQKFGLSLAGGEAARGGRRVLDACRGSTCAACTPTSAARSSTRPASRWRPTGSSACTPNVRDEFGRRAARARPRRWLRHRLHDPATTRCRRRRAGRGLAEIVVRECAALGVAVPRLRSSPAGPSPGRRPARSTRSARSRWSSSTAACPHLRRVDGGMSDNVRTALYDADYSCTLASRSCGAPAVLSRVVGKHCESGDIVVKDEFLPGDLARRRPAGRAGHRAPTAAAWPASTTTCRGRRSSRCGTAGPGDRPPGDRGRHARPRRRLASPDDWPARCGPGPCMRVTLTDVARVASATGVESRGVAGHGRAPLRVALLGCGVVGTEVARLLGEHADDLRRGSGRRWSWSASPCAGSSAGPRPRLARPELFTTDAEALVTRRVDVVVEVIGGIEPARSLILAAMEHGASVVTANKALLADDGADPVRSAADEAASTSTTRPPSPVRSRCCARCASRSPATGYAACWASSTAPPTTSSTRWTRPAPASPRRSSRRRPWATPRPTRRPTSRASTPRRRRRSWPHWPSTPGSTAADVHREGITEVTAADVARRAAMGGVVKLLAICERVDRGLDGRSRRCGCTRR